MYNFFHGFKKMFALVIVFFVPELMEVFGTSLLFNSSVVKRLFSDTFKSREKSGELRGDFIDSLLQLKQGEQNPEYSGCKFNISFRAWKSVSSIIRKSIFDSDFNA